MAEERIECCDVPQVHQELVLKVNALLPDEEELRILLSDAEDQPGPRLGERAVAAGGAVAFQFFPGPAHSSLPPSNSFSASSQRRPSARASPAGRSSMFSAFDRR